MEEVGKEEQEGVEEVVVMDPDWCEDRAVFRVKIVAESSALTATRRDTSENTAPTSDLPASAELASDTSTLPTMMMIMRMRVLMRGRRS